MFSNSTPLWESGGASVRGATHRRSGTPNQDAWNKWQSDSLYALAVADGHGSTKSFRSDRGARMAVESAIKIVSEFLQDKELHLPRSLQELCETGLHGKFVSTWSQQVDSDLASDAFSSQERETLVQHSGDGAWTSVEKNPRLAYGSTLLVAAISPEFVAFWQLGDGDILTVSPDGKTVSRPIPEDPSLIANETTSLCMANATQQFRTGLSLADDKMPLPLLILLSSDGYANSFVSPKAFDQVATDLLAFIQKQGFGSVCAKLDDWLNETSAEGSGDDVTVGLLWNRTEPTTKPTPANSSPNGATDDSPEQRSGLSTLPDQSPEGAPETTPPNLPNNTSHDSFTQPRNLP